MEIIGWIGVVTYVGAYGLLSLGWLRVDRVYYHILNAVGGMCLVIIAYEKLDMPNFFVNLIWIAIAFFSIIRLLVKKKSS